MSAADKIGELIARLDRTQALLQRVLSQYEQFLAEDLPTLGRKNTSAIVIAELMVDYYTCAETLFLRISQFFENELDTARWHADLLDKMLLRIDGVRDAVIGEPTAQSLGELMRFRHFRRYYFELEYDWDRLEFLQKVFAKVRHALPADLERFRAFLAVLQEETDA